MKQKLKKIIKVVMYYTVVLMVSIIVAVCLRVFVVTSIILIPSGSMEPAVMTGDRIIAGKLIPGPRVFKNFRQIRMDGKVQTKRFKGIRKVKRNDILVFNFPYSGSWEKIDMDLNVFYLKRCVGLPGDMFSIENGIYNVKASRDSLGCSFRQRELSEMSKNDFSPDIWQSFPYDTLHYQWNIKDFGPLQIPASGESFRLDTLNIVLYKKLIEYETAKPVFVRDGLVYSGDEVINDYTFRLNYYFMAGDFIFDSKDSRYWGLLPEDCIIGKALLVWRSTDLKNGRIRWDRIFKIINN